MGSQTTAIGRVGKRAFRGTGQHNCPLKRLTLWTLQMDVREEQYVSAEEEFDNWTNGAVKAERTQNIIDFQSIDARLSKTIGIGKSVQSMSYCHLLAHLRWYFQSLYQAPPPGRNKPALRQSREPLKRRTFYSLSFRLTRNHELGEPHYSQPEEPMPSPTLLEDFEMHRKHEATDPFQTEEQQPHQREQLHTSSNSAIQLLIVVLLSV